MNESEFIYFEDRDLETGHGWRDKPVDELFVSFVADKDSELKIGIDEYHMAFVSASYFWITRRESFEKTGCCAADELRTQDILNVLPDFIGVSDMEGHFEFNMNPKRAIRYLASIGIMNGNSNS